MRVAALSLALLGCFGGPAPEDIACRSSRGLELVAPKLDPDPASGDPRPAYGAEAPDCEVFQKREDEAVAHFALRGVEPRTSAFVLNGAYLYVASKPLAVLGQPAGGLTVCESASMEVYDPRGGVPAFTHEFAHLLLCGSGGDPGHAHPTLWR